MKTHETTVTAATTGEASDLAPIAESPKPGSSNQSASSSPSSSSSTSTAETTAKKTPGAPTLTTNKRKQKSLSNALVYDSDSQQQLTDENSGDAAAAGADKSTQNVDANKSSSSSPMVKRCKKEPTRLSVLISAEENERRLFEDDDGTWFKCNDCFMKFLSQELLDEHAVKHSGICCFLLLLLKYH